MPLNLDIFLHAPYVLTGMLRGEV